MTRATTEGTPPSTGSGGGSAAAGPTGPAYPVQAVNGRGTVRLLRTVTLLACIETLVQAALAGQFMTGDSGKLSWHEANTGLLVLLTALQIVGAVLLWRRNRQLRWPIPLTVVVLLLTVAQAVLGANGETAVHIPVGVAICGAEAALVLWAFLLRPNSPNGLNSPTEPDDSGTEAVRPSRTA
ncbi:hypothetical protein LHJ74_22590 [Streptomyces sp. N2-109]|uniref:Integral membrane protein n=1 Tax=Streptomyces gossypii TaxID=2883101 RepID=A0ABT2JXN7_9ACTN|nr:hypothetical protein [Streptomyces gossypii]MCT2592665.1 hypothetical protein [Streptomyces gossypii]